MSSVDYAAIIPHEAMAIPYKWFELIPPKYPEGDYVAVFCKCGNKNRQDEGWRYCYDPSAALETEAIMRKSLYLFMRLDSSPAMRNIPKLTYECDCCRGDEKRRKEEDPVPVNTDDSHVTQDEKQKKEEKHKESLVGSSNPTPRALRAAAREERKSQRG